MKPKITIKGNLTANAAKKQKTDGKEYHIFTVAYNDDNNNKVYYYTCFAYGVSDARANLLTKGTQVFVHGDYSDSLTENPKTQQVEINRIVQIIYFDILLTKKAE